MDDGSRQTYEVLFEAEKKLRRLLEIALSEQRYGDVARIAPFADGLLKLVNGANGSPATPLLAAPIPKPEGDSLEVHRTTGPAVSRQKVANTSTRQADVSYPRFERHGDRLVKLAWSKKDRREYEHRAPIDVILRVAELFEAHGATGSPFLMDVMMPFKSASGGEIPSYQAYLALAWFRTFGAVEARGKDGYAVVVPDLRQRVEQAWNDLPDALRK